MRLLLRNHQPYRLWNVKDYIQQIQSNIIAQDNQQYIAIQNLFTKIYQRHLNENRTIHLHKNHLKNYLLASPAPATAIAGYFHRKSRSFSQQFLRITLQALGSAYQISKRDNNGSLDTLGYKLFLSSEFSNISEELKYGLKHNKITFDNLVPMLEALLQLQHADYEIINLLILYTQRQIEGGDEFQQLNHWPGDRQFQIQKHSYYDPNQTEVLQSFKSSQELATAISFVRHIHKEWSLAEQQKMHLKQQNIHELNTLVDQMAKTNKNFSKLVEGILNIRRQYVKMVTVSQNQVILRNPNLNMELLQLQEKLMNVKLISIGDIKSPQMMKDSNYEIKRVEEILLHILKVQRLDPLLAYIDKSTQQVSLSEQNTQAKPHKIAILINLLANFASLDRHLYHTQDGRTLINIKWQKTLIPQQAKMAVTHQQEQLNVSRMFRRVYGQVVQFVQKNVDKIDKIFKRSLLTQRLDLIQGYLTIGLNQLAISNFNEINQQELSKIPHLSQQNFVKLISVLNTVGIFIQNADLKRNVLQKLQRLIWQQENNTLALNLNFSIEAVNYLIQNHRQESTYTSLYKRALDLLQTKALYYPPTLQQNQALVDAIKILAIERPHKFISHPVYVSYLQQISLDNYKRNVYHSILRQAGHKWTNKASSLNKLQTFLPIGFNQGILNAIFFSNSDETSLDGSLRSGNLNAQIIRLQLHHKIQINELSTNSFLSVNYSADHQSGKLFTLSKVQQLQSRLQQIYQRESESYEKLYQSIADKLISVLQTFASDVITNKIHFKMSVLNRLRNNNSNIQTKEQQYTNKAQFLLEALQLNKLVQLLDIKLILNEIHKTPSTHLPINPKLANSNQDNQHDTLIEVDQQSIKSMLSEIRKSFPVLIDQISQYINSKNIKAFVSTESTSNPYLQGQRQSIDLLEASSSQLKETAPYFINRAYYNDKTYCEYSDWRQNIIDKYNYVQLEYQKMSNLSKILAQKFCGKVNNTINLMPLCKHEQRYKRLKMQFKLLEEIEGVEQASGEGNLKEKDLDYIINLQNFKHQLKTQFSEQELIDYIFSFTFANNLNSKHNNRAQLLLPRNTQHYFNYLETINDHNYLESPYAHYIISKLTSTSHIKQLLQQRKQLRTKLKMQYQEGKISGKEYFNLIDVFEEKILQAVKQLKTKLLDYTSDSLIENEFKMVKIKKEEFQLFEELINKQISYNRQFDEDFIYANGDYEKALNLRRGRAQSNYIKFYLLKKVMEEKQLNAKQKQLLREWHSNIIESVSSFVVYKSYTTTQISQLSWQDLQKLKLKNTSLIANKDMLLIDLILQLNNFLDPEFINNYQCQIKANYLAQRHNIPYKLFQKTNSIAFKKINLQVQASIKEEKSRFSEQDLGRIEQLFKIYKIEGFKERTRYGDVCKNVGQNLKAMNKQYIRNQLIEEYLKQLDQQFLSDYNGSLIEQIKEKEMDKLWREIFKQKYDTCSTLILKETVRKIILRLEIIGKNPPPFFGNLLISILKHPNIDSIAKESLIAAIELYNFNLNLDSWDIEKLSQLGSNVMAESDLRKGQLRDCTGSKVSVLLKNKIAKII